MKKVLLAVMLGLAFSGAVDAKPGGGGGHVSSGGGGRSFSSPSPVHPIATPSPSKGSFSAAPSPSPSQKGSFSAPPAAAPRQTTTATSTTTMTRRTAGGGYASAPVMYGGMGMGFGYTNGLLTGLIIGNMMHPTNTVVYSGGGYNGNALLYPDGRVVNQQGYQVGTYQNGQFSPVNGGMVAQPAPTDAVQYQNSPTQPVVLEKAGPSNWEIAGMIVLGIACVLLFLFIIGVL
jgi:hypothetical protein